MTPGRARLLLFDFVKDIYDGPSKDIEVQWGDLLNDLGDKLAKVIIKDEDIEVYLNSVLEYIDGLNKFFAKQKNRSRIPYSKLLSFANKDERISEFILEKGLKKKISSTIKSFQEEVDMAGFTYKNEDEEASIIFDNEVYTKIYETMEKGFFFSPITNALIVRISDNKTVTYSKYRELAKKNKIKYLRKREIYNRLRDVSDSDIIISYRRYYENLIRSLEKKKGG